MTESFALDAIDDVIHGRLRLGIMAYLLGSGEAEFVQLKEKTGATDGNLSVQLRKLEEVGYVHIDKIFVGKKPLTRIVLSEPGRQALLAYLGNMQKLIDEALG